MASPNLKPAPNWRADFPALSGAVHSAAGWAGVCAAGGGLAALVLLLWGLEQARA